MRDSHYRSRNLKVVAIRIGLEPRSTVVSYARFCDIPSQLVSPPPQAFYILHKANKHVGMYSISIRCMRSSEGEHAIQISGDILSIYGGFYFRSCLKVK